MATNEIEIRVLALENEVNSLKNKLEKIEKNPNAWWQKIVGTFSDDADYEEAMKLGREYRMSQKEDNENSQ